MYYFTFDNVDSRTFNTYVTASNWWDSPEENIETISVPYSNNIFYISNGTFKPFDLIVTCLIYDSDGHDIDNLRNFLQSRGKQCKYVDSFKTGEYRVARFKRAFNVKKTDYEKMFTFDLEFECMPQRFLTSGDTAITLTSSGAITNPTSFGSRPLLRVYSTGTLVVNGYSIAVNSVSGYVDIDCESMQCYKGTTNCNNNVTIDEFPILKSGSNTVTLTGVSRVDITPRWWTI